ncbi:MAG: hypothetical protein MSC30_18290, partial [Gaiellaceae bacterium MAG52_C11]|nr:hypothetical protein [Candidatus Gaiellasilicea maunaloa]
MLELRALAPDGSPVEGFRFDGHTVTYEGKGPLDAGIRVERLLPATDDPDWLVPGVFYGENRPEGNTRLYPRWTPGGTSVERLESDSWSFRADRCSTPAVFARGGGLVTREVSPVGQAGVGFALREDRPVIWLDFPYREEPLRYNGHGIPDPPDVQTYRWQPGESVELFFETTTGDYATVLRKPATPFEDPSWVSLEDAAELTAWGLWRWHYRSDPPRLLETAAFDRDAFGAAGDRDNMHVSWVSGTPYAYALLRHGRRVGNEAYVEAATAVLDHVASNLTPGGTLWAQWTSERGWTSGWHPDRMRL